MKRHITCIAFFFLTLTSCQSNGQDTFPDVVANSKSDNLKRVRGTKLFVNTPSNYQPLEKLVRLQKDDRTYFQVIEVPNSNFVEYKSKMSRQAIESQGAKVDAYEAVKFNGFDGLYFEGPSKIEGETKIGLAFGDETFVTMVVGVCRTEDQSSRQEIKNIFSTAYYDKSFKLNPLELANFQIDETITGFKYAATMGNMFLYSPNGKADMKGLLDFSSFQIMPLDAGSFEKIQELMETINSRLDRQGVQVSNIKKKELTIDGNKAYEVTMDATDKEGKKGTFYEVGIFKQATSSGVLFIGADTDKGAYLDKFKATVQSMKL
jgi:hypothetical protein